MTPIETNQDLDDFFREDAAVLFYNAAWSAYAVVSKPMMELVESQLKAAGRSTHFFMCCFEGDLVPLAQRLVARNVPNHVFAGWGSASFFRGGDHVDTIRSVVGEGTHSVWKQLAKLT